MTKENLRQQVWPFNKNALPAGFPCQGARCLLSRDKLLYNKSKEHLTSRITCICPVRDSTAGNFRTALSGNGSRLSVFPERDVDRDHSVSLAHRIAIRIKGDPAISLESVRTSDRSVVSELNLSVRIGTDKSGPIIDIRGLEYIRCGRHIHKFRPALVGQSRSTAYHWRAS